MQIIDLNDQYEKLYFVCLEDWSEGIKQAGNHKATWYFKMKDKGLRVKLALNDRGIVGGMIAYLPIEHSFAEGKDLYFINCIFVHDHKEGRGNFQKQGMGKALLQAAEDDVKALGAGGIAGWGIPEPFRMKACWFKKRGYTSVDKLGLSGKVLLWKPFSGSTEPPKWVRPKKTPEFVPGKVTVTAFLNGWCPAQNIVYERAKRAAAEIGDGVIFQSIDTSDRENYLEWGMSDALFIDGKQMRTGPPPPTYEKIKNAISSKARKL